MVEAKPLKYVASILALELRAKKALLNNPVCGIRQQHEVKSRYVVLFSVLLLPT